MFYVLLCFHRGVMSGTEISDYVYTILGAFQAENVIEKTGSEGRRISYRITEKGERLFQEEVDRMRKCLADADRVTDHEE